MIIRQRSSFKFINISDIVEKCHNGKQKTAPQYEKYFFTTNKFEAETNYTFFCCGNMCTLLVHLTSCIFMEKENNTVINIYVTY